MGAEVETYCSWRRFPAGRHETTREKKSPFLGFALTQRQKRKTRVRTRRETLTGREREAASQGPPGPGRDSSQAMQRRSFWGKRLKGGPGKADGGACEQRARGTGLASTLPARAPVVTSGTRRPPALCGAADPFHLHPRIGFRFGETSQRGRSPAEGQAVARGGGGDPALCPAAGASGRVVPRQLRPRNRDGPRAGGSTGLTSDRRHWTTRDAAPREMPLKQRAFQK